MWIASFRLLVRITRRSVLTLLGFVVGADLVMAADEAVINLHFNTRVPYEYIEKGEVVGTVATPIEQAFRKAGVKFRWIDVPVARQFHTVKANKGLDCLAGRFKNPERESWAQFSKPIYRDRPQILLARSDNDRMKAFVTMSEALRSADVRVLVKLSYSYGPIIDAWLNQRRRPVVVTADENYDMLRQINLGLADVIIIAEEEAESLVQASGLPSKNFQLLKFRDAPPGEFRYIMCSKSVPASVMANINAAITFRPD